MSDNEYDSYSDENDENEEFTNETSEEDEEIEEMNDLILDNSNDSEDSEDSDTEVITLKTTMVFPKKGQSTSKINPIKPITPMPQLKGIILPKQKIEPPKKNVKQYSTEEMELLLEKIPGINVSTNTISYDRLELSDLLEKEAQESVKDFNTRKEITLKIARINNPVIKNNTCIVLGLMIAKKLRFGIKYDEDVETLIKDILAMLV